MSEDLITSVKIASRQRYEASKLFQYLVQEYGRERAVQIYNELVRKYGEELKEYERLLSELESQFSFYSRKYQEFLSSPEYKRYKSLMSELEDISRQYEAKRKELESLLKAGKIREARKIYYELYRMRERYYRLRSELSEIYPDINVKVKYYFSPLYESLMKKYSRVEKLAFSLFLLFRLLRRSLASWLE